MDVEECRRRFAAADHAYLATADAAGTPHVVPVTYAVDGDAVVHVVDAKPKRTTNLRRLRNIAANPRVCFLVDRYDDDWARLWWVRADAVARVVESGPELDHAVRLLQARYARYLTDVPAGPVLWAEVTRWTGWSAESPG